MKRDGKRKLEKDVGREGVWKGKGEREGKGHGNGKGRRGVKIEKGFGKKWENKESGRGKGKVLIKRRSLKEKRT